MKRLLILAATYEPFKDGVAEAARVMAVGLAARGYQVTVGTGYHPERSPDLPGANPTVKQFRVTGSASWCEGYQGEVDIFREFVAGFAGDFIICHCWQIWSTDLAVPEFGRTPARKILASQGFTAQLIHWHRRFPWGLGQWIGWVPYTIRLPFFLKKFTHVVFVSQHTDQHRFFDHWLARLIGHPGVAIIPNSVDPEKFKQPLSDFRKEYAIGPGLMFLCVANYTTRKNQALAVRAFRQAQIRGATLVFIGSEFNPYQAFVRNLDLELAQSYPSGHVRFLERINRELTLAAFNACDVFVLTATEETQPFVLLEAMACGKPFISTESSGCIRELAGGVVVNSEQEISAQMKWLSENPAVRRTLGKAGREAVDASYTCERVVTAFEELLR